MHIVPAAKGKIKLFYNPKPNPSSRILMYLGMILSLVYFQGLLSGPFRFRFHSRETNSPANMNMDISAGVNSTSAHQNEPIGPSCWSYGCEKPQVRASAQPAACCCLIAGAWTKTACEDIEMEVINRT